MRVLALFPLYCPWIANGVRSWIRGGRPRKREASDPVGVASANDGTGRIFVVERVGRIKVVAKDGRVLPDPYLDDKGAVANPPGALWRVLPESQVPAGAQTAPVVRR